MVLGVPIFKHFKVFLLKSKHDKRLHVPIICQVTLYFASTHYQNITADHLSAHIFTTNTFFFFVS